MYLLKQSQRLPNESLHVAIKTTKIKIRPERNGIRTHDLGPRYSFQSTGAAPRWLDSSVDRGHG